jgi:hypothetical protein
VSGIVRTGLDVESSAMLEVELELTCDLCQVGSSVSHLYRTPVFRINDRRGWEVVSVPSRWMICKHCHPLIHA